MDKNMIGSRIAGLRKEKNFSQVSLAKALSSPERLISRERIAKWEAQDDVIPRPQDIIMLADFFGVSCDYILRGHNPENVVVVHDLGLSDYTIERMREYKSSGACSYGIIDHLFDLKHGYMPWIMECIDNALEIGRLMNEERRKLNKADDLEPPKINVGNGIEIEHSIVIEALVRNASESFAQSVREFIDMSTRKEE